MRLSKIFKNTLLVLMACIVLTSCATKKEVETQTTTTTTSTEAKTEKTDPIQPIAKSTLPKLLDLASLQERPLSGPNKTDSLARLLSQIN